MSNGIIALAVTAAAVTIATVVGANHAAKKKEHTRKTAELYASYRAAENAVHHERNDDLRLRLQLKARELYYAYWDHTVNGAK